MSEKKRCELYIEAREKGLKYREIAEMYGVSCQRVAQVCSNRMDGHFRPYTEKDCIYPKLRNWLNGNKVARNELSRRVFGDSESAHCGLISSWLHGRNYPTKKNIDRLLAVTCLTYEQLFTTDADLKERFENWGCGYAVD